MLLLVEGLLQGRTKLCPAVPHLPGQQAQYPAAGRLATTATHQQQTMGNDHNGLHRRITRDQEQTQRHTNSS